MKIEELEIPVPWGHIAAKLWGDEKNEPILVIHGILDNAGSFERLIKLLPEHFYYICLDLPGHGRSSHWPEFAMYNTLDNLLVYKAAVDFFKRKKYIIMGHSYGAQLGFIYAQIYPEFVSKLIMLDSIYLWPRPPSLLKSSVINNHEVYFETMKKLKDNKPPEYTYQQAIDRLMNNRRYGQISYEAAEPVLKRMMIPTADGKLKLSLDQRLKFFQNPTFDNRYIADFVKKNPVLCPVLIILAAESDSQRIYFKSLLKLLKSYKNIRIKHVEGDHDVHNENPDRVAPLITKMLLWQKTKL